MARSFLDVDRLPRLSLPACARTEQHPFILSSEAQMVATSAVIRLQLKGVMKSILVGYDGSLSKTGLALYLFLYHLKPLQWNELEGLLRKGVQWYYTPGRTNPRLT
jgi:hypothetical protein